MSDTELLNEVREVFLNGNFGSSEEVLLGLLIIVGALLLVIAIIGIVFLILDVIGKWKMFKKAGESGWKALIPIYNTYTQCEIIGVSPWWLLVILIGYFITSFFAPFKFILEIILVYFSIIIALSTARSFGKTDGFGIGLFLLSPVFNMILGFDSSKYEGKKPIGDLLSATTTTKNTTVKEVKSTNAQKSKTTTDKTYTKKKSTPKKKTTAKKTATKPKTTRQTSKKTTTRKAVPKKTTTNKSKTTKKK